MWEFFKSFSLLLVGILRRLYFLIPTLVTDPLDILERWFKVMYQPPQWIFWALLILGLALATLLSYHEMRMQKINAENQLKQRDQRDFSLVWRIFEFRLITPEGTSEYWNDENNGLALRLVGSIVVNTLKQIQVEDVSLEIGGALVKSDWKSEGFYTSEERDVNIEFPLNTQRGLRTARVQAIIDGNKYLGEQFTIDFPQEQRVFRRVDSSPQ